MARRVALGKSATKGVCDVDERASKNPQKTVPTGRKGVFSRVQRWDLDLAVWVAKPCPTGLGKL